MFQNPTIEILFWCLIIAVATVLIAIVAIINSVISLYYYVRIVKVMFLRGYEEGEMEGVKPHVSSVTTVVVLAVLAISVTVSGIFWEPIARWVGNSAHLFLP